MRVKLLIGDPPLWQQFEAFDELYVNVCKRCAKDFDTPIKERSYCTDKCQFATWNDNAALKKIGNPTVKTPNRS